VLEGPSPASPGPVAVRTLYYGSGTDRNRAEYRDSVSLRTDSVDASLLVDLGDSADDRNGYWGFSPEGFPINGRVWYPEGPGPFPLVLVVHGNHDPRDFSDPGYDYLGELLASRGFILASVDMNFLNGGIRGENDARGWMLLKHLEAWRAFNEAEDGPFRNRVDLSRIALMGHSRGGEAVAIAAAFNRLPRYPDNAELVFDFNFDIRSVVAIAPVDGQYRPTGRGAPLEDVNYLVFHGSHDGDVTSFHGLRQWDRVTFPGGGDRFKAAVYMYRANHGQWNSVWNALDNGPRSARILDLRYLVPAEDQRRFAELYVTAFLESTLNDEERWLPLFRDHRVAGGWLPPTMYVTRMRHASFRPLADFEEDIDVTTGTHPGVTLDGHRLESWKEETLMLRSSNRSSTSSSQENQGVRLAWAPGSENDAGDESADSSAETPAYVVRLPRGLARSWAVDGETSVTLSVAATPRIPRGEGEDGEGRAAREGGEEPPLAVDLSLEVVDTAGRSARVSLSDYGPVRRPLEIRILRRGDREEDRFARPWELVLLSLEVPLADFTALEPDLELAGLAELRLVFDGSPGGEIVVDDVGLSRLGGGFWDRRIDPATGLSATPR